MPDSCRQNYRKTCLIRGGIIIVFGFQEDALKEDDYSHVIMFKFRPLQYSSNKLFHYQQIITMIDYQCNHF